MPHGCNFDSFENAQSCNPYFNARQCQCETKPIINHHANFITISHTSSKEKARQLDKKKQGDRLHFIFYVWFSIVLKVLN